MFCGARTRHAGVDAFLDAIELIEHQKQAPRGNGFVTDSRNSPRCLKCWKLQ